MARRGPTGSYITTSTTGEAVAAFAPEPLPPPIAFDLGGERQRLLESAVLACGRLDGVSAVLPDPKLFLYSYLRREAVLSSQIEGTQSSLSDLLMFELDEAPGAPIDDVVEVSNYVAACELGISRLGENFPISSRLIREVHGRLLARGRGASQTPGSFRTSQNWIGGTRPGNAAFVPPPPHLVADCMSDLERFIHSSDSLPVLVRAAAAHVQFETIHPFLDGNGRIGRLLIVLMLIDARVLRQPLLYLSLFLKQHRVEYYRLLDLVRREGDWEAWLEFFLEGVTQTASSAVETAERLLRLFAEDERRVSKSPGASPSAQLVYAALRQRPITTIKDIAKRSGVSIPTATKAVALLVDAGIARELSGRLRDRLFGYDAYLAILNEGADPI